MRSKLPDDVPALLSASFIAASSVTVTNVLPLLLGVIVARYSADPVQVGLINSCLTGASLLAAASAPFWVHRVPWHWTCIVAGIGATTVFALAPAAHHIETIYGLFLLAGWFSGLLSGPSNAALGFSSSPMRWYGIGTLWQNIISATFYFVVPSWVQARFGYEGVLSATAIALAPCMIVGWLVRRPAQYNTPVSTGVPTEKVATQRAVSSRNWPALGAAFAATLLFSSGGVSYWVFLERLGKNAGLSDAFIGSSLGVSNVAAIIGSIIAATVKRRSFRSLAVGIAAGVIGFTVMLDRQPPSFLASVCLYNFAWSLAMPALQAIIRQGDFTNRLFVASPSTVYVAAVVTGPLVGLLVIPYGYNASLYYSITLWVVALVFGLYACKHATVQASPHRHLMD